MDSNASAAAGYFKFVGSSSEYNYINIGKDYINIVEDDSNNNINIIDLGLSLRALQPAADDLQAYNYPSTHAHAHENYQVLVDWQQLHPQPQVKLKGIKHDDEINIMMMNKNICDDEESESEPEGIQSKQRCWTMTSNYVKVNMDGVIVGRKICILHNMDYFTLAFQLEDMFGKLCMCGLRLFEDDSEFSLFYKDKNELWRTVGDVPWREFVNHVTRLRIVRKLR
ncbi:hypothetical protein ACJIZ3_020132 [Penstemon smallii]|uniref:Auxin-responsive protein n=1 Tax=Penstemon smallii TaxID=265156 RepID=A0ABD3SIC3_9LAMI